MKTTEKVFYNNLKKFTGNSNKCFQYLQIVKEYKYATDGFKLIGFRHLMDAQDIKEECIDIVEEKVVENVKPVSIGYLFPQDTKKIGLNSDNVNQMLRFCRAVKCLDVDGTAEIQIKMYVNALFMRYKKDNISLVDFFKVDDKYLAYLFYFNANVRTFIPLLEVFKNFEIGQILKVPQRPRKSGNCMIEYDNLFAICPINNINLVGDEENE